MTSAELLTIFEVLLDKYGSPYLTDDEMYSLLNMAQYERFNRLLPDDMGGQVNFEFDENTLQNIRPFVFNLTGLVTVSGLLSDSTINTALVSASHAGAEIFRIMNVSKSGVPIKWVKHNNLNAYNQNVFKAPDTDNIKYTLLKTGVQFYPTSTTGVDLTVIKRPRTISVSVDPEWDNYGLNLVIMIALQLSGVSVRDQELIGAIQNVNVAK